MNQKTAKRLRHLVIDTSSDGKLNRPRYRTLKSLWNKMPWNQRQAFMNRAQAATTSFSS